MLKFNFLENGLGIVSLPHFVNDFSREMFLTLYCNDWPVFIARLSLLLEMWVNVSVKFVCWPGCDVVDFRVCHIFLIRPFSCVIKASRQRFECLENEMSLRREMESIFHHF